MVGDPTVRSVPPLGSVFMGGLGEPDFVPVSCLRQHPASGCLLLPEELAVCPAHLARSSGRSGSPLGLQEEAGRDACATSRWGEWGAAVGFGGDTVPAMGCGCPSPPTAPVPVGFAPWVPLAPRGCCGPFVLGFWCEEGSVFGTLCFCWQGAAVVYRGWFSSTWGHRGVTEVSPGYHRGVSVLPLRSASSSAAGSCSKSGKCKATAAPGALNGAEPFLLRAPVPRPPVSALAPCPSGPQVPLRVQQCAAGVPWGGTKPGVLCSVCGHSSSEL